MEETFEQHDVEQVVELFKALAHPIRAQIVRCLIDKPCDVGHLANCTQASQPLVSHHLKILRDRHLVEVTRVGRNNQYALIDEHVASIFLDAHNHTREHDHDCKH